MEGSSSEAASHLPVSRETLKSKYMKWKLRAWQDKPHLMPVVPRKQRCWSDLTKKGACSSLVVSELSIPELPSGSAALPFSIASFCSWVPLAPVLQCSLYNFCSWPLTSSAGTGINLVVGSLKGLKSVWDNCEESWEPAEQPSAPTGSCPKLLLL